MLPLRWVLLLLVAPALLAGCAGRDGGEATSPPTASTSAGTPAPTPGTAGLLLEGPVVTPLDGRERPLREDDGALITFTVRNPPDAKGTASGFVSYILNGNVSDVEAVRLEPGKAKTYERRIEEVRGLKQVSIEVRAGSAQGKVVAPVLAWPRQGETLPFEPYFHARVDSWAVDAMTNETVVGVSLARGTSPFYEFRVHLMCVGAEGGEPRSAGVVRPALQPHPGTSEAFEVRLPPCPAGATTYGVDVKADVEGDRSLFGRVLFVPVGWTPPAAAPAS